VPELLDSLDATLIKVIDFEVKLSMGDIKPSDEARIAPGVEKKRCTQVCPFAERTRSTVKFKFECAGASGQSGCSIEVCDQSGGQALNGGYFKL